MIEQQLQQLREQLRITTVRLQAVTQLSGDLHQWHEPMPAAMPPQRQHLPQLPPLPLAPQWQRPQPPRPPAGGLMESAVAASLLAAQVLLCAAAWYCKFLPSKASRQCT